jgi:tetratricopeptide (TPR) repeat protein
VIPLDGATPDEIAARTARGLGLAASPDPGARVAEALAERGALLLVLDAAESCADVLGAWITAWRRAAPSVRILITSRCPVPSASAELRLGPLPEPDALALLASAAPALLRPELDPTVGRLVTCLGGHPLAIELCAGRLGRWTPTELVDELELALGATGDGALARTFAGSWGALAPGQREALAVLALLLGAIPGREAARVTGGTRADIDDLADLGWLQPAGDGLWIPRLLRQFVASRGGPPLEGQARLAAWLLAHGEAALAGIRGERPADGRRLADATVPDLARLARDRDEPDAVRLAAGLLLVDLDAPLEAEAALGGLGPLNGGAERARRRSLGRARVRLLRPGGVDDLRAGLQADGDDGMARLALATALAERGDLAGSLALARHVAQTAADPWIAGQGWCQVAGLAGHLGESELLAEAAELAQDAFRRCGSRAGEARALDVLARRLLDDGRIEHAHGTAALALDLLEQTGENRLLATVCGLLGQILHERGDLEPARASLDRAVSLSSLGGGAPLGAHLALRAMVLAEAGDTRGAEEDLRRSLGLFGDHPYRHSVEMMEAMLRLRRGQVDRAATLLAAYLEGKLRHGMAWNPTYGLALAGVLLADAGHPAAGPLFDAAEARLRRWRSELELNALEIHRAHLDWALHRQGDPEAAPRARRRARIEPVGASGRFALLWLRKAVRPDGRTALAPSAAAAERLARACGALAR